MRASVISKSSSEAAPGWLRRRMTALRAARRIAVLCAGLGVAGGAWAQENGSFGADGEAGRRSAFTIRIEAPGELRELLERHLDIERYRHVPDLDREELRRLLSRAEIDARRLLATQGYFSAKVSLRLDEPDTPSAATPQVVVEVDPGEATRVERVDLAILGAGLELPPARAQFAELRAQWGLPVGARFTQDGWRGAKSRTLQGLQMRRFPTARLVDSAAEVDPAGGTAHLALHYDSGPAYRLGEVRIVGAERYDESIARHLARLRRGDDYDQRVLLNAQRYLTDSGYYRSALARVETGPEVDPQAAPVLIEVEEERLKKQTIGVGLSTDYGPRLSVEQIDNRSLLFGWRSVAKAEINARQRNLQYGVLAPPDAQLWRWLANASAQREKVNDYTTDTQRFKAGRSKLEMGLERSVYLQYDSSRTLYESHPQKQAQALTLNHAWTYRRFDSQIYPRSGYGLALEVGAGSTLYPQTSGLVRAYGRYLGFFSLDGNFVDNLRRALPSLRQLGAIALGDAEALADGEMLDDLAIATVPRRNGELVLRLEAGATNAGNDASIPASLLFLTGGDTTVRGYNYRSIGISNRYGEIEGGRYLFAGSIEYRRPLLRDGRSTDWDGLVFVDAGSVSEKLGQFATKVGVGGGVLWHSPVGPVQIAAAYGIQSRAFRLHLNLGFSF